MLMGAPSGNYDRVGNLHDQNASAGLTAMHGGRISANSNRKIRSAVEWLLCSASWKWLKSKQTGTFHKWQLSFLTLTLPTQGNMTDKQVKEILNAWLTLAKYNYGLKSYIWKAEPQKRGEIHFHITSDCYMWKKSVQYEWNRLLSKSGLLNGHANPPSTRIHSTYKVKNMAAYLTKYFCKGEPQHTRPPFRKKFEGIEYQPKGHTHMHPLDMSNLFYIRPIQGRLWGCSHTLSQARSLSYTIDVPEMRATNDELRTCGAREKQNTYGNFYKLPDDYYENLTYGQLKHDYNFHRRKIRKDTNLHQFEIYNQDGSIINDPRVIARLKKETPCPKTDPSTMF